MCILWSKEIDSILNIGISLESLGVKNWALNRKNALDVLHHFESLNICVLGGDVYIL
ncbi:hypothetical protein AUB46_21630, partial [Salmonella enterica subsp. enterica serovar Typhimurium var. 5-]|nr:hypothetical protein [Salmonella enterica]EBW8165363.1 hypothetical protein [Salmonella enterica subsp. enterica serovar Typhimurium var. 5-]